MSRSIAARISPREPSARRASMYAATPGVVPSSAVVQRNSIERRGVSAASAVIDLEHRAVARCRCRSRPAGARDRDARGRRSARPGAPGRRTPLTFQLVRSGSRSRRACAPRRAARRSRGGTCRRRSRRRRPRGSARRRTGSRGSRSPPRIDIRYGQGSGWTTTIAAAPVARGERHEGAEPETRVAESDLLDHGDLSFDVEAGIVVLLAPADEDELRLDAACRRRRREVGRDGVDEASRLELELDSTLAVAERRELAVDHLRPAPGSAANELGRLGVSGGADEAVAVTRLDESLDRRDRALPADAVAQVTLFP